MKLVVFLGNYAYVFAYTVWNRIGSNVREVFGFFWSQGTDLSIIKNLRYVLGYGYKENKKIRFASANCKGITWLNRVNVSSAYCSVLIRYKKVKHDRLSGRAFLFGLLFYLVLGKG